MSGQFSIDLSLCKIEVSSLERELEELKEQVEDIYRRAVIKDSYPVAQIVVEQLGATPSELKMLSKVFDRLAILVAKRDDVKAKHSALTFINTKDSWLYDKIGSPSRDVEHFLSTFTTAEIE